MKREREERRKRRHLMFEEKLVTLPTDIFTGYWIWSLSETMYTL